jgi:hypothetical protein
VAEYYYLASQLPYLVYGQEAPMTPAAFRELASRFIEDEDKRQLAELSVYAPQVLPKAAIAPMPSDPPPITSPFILEWREWERSLRLNLLRYRAQRLKREGSSAAADVADIPEYPADAANAAKAATTMESPLEAEMSLDKARWEAIERIRGLDNNGSAFVFAYMLKLMLMERRSSFITEEGFMEYKSLYATIVKNANTSVVGVEDNK